MWLIFKKHTLLLRALLVLLLIAGVILLNTNHSLHTWFSPKDKKPIAVASSEPTTLMNGLVKPYPASEISGINDWINSGPLNINDFKGEVILVDFWAYSCMNCIRMLPYLNDWYDQYHDHGLNIIGVHSPKFDFEKNLDNVENAVKKDHIQYPVALDNQFTTWQNFRNSYWPALYLIDKNGFVVYERFGEGDDDVTENNIRYLLGLGKGNEIAAANKTPVATKIPETYLGYARADSFVTPIKLIKDRSTSYQYPNKLPDNTWALNGDWQVDSQKIINTSKGAGIKLHFQAGKVFAVMGSQTQQAIPVNIHQDGVLQKQILVGPYTLYPLLDLQQETNSTIELTIDAPGLEIYTFTFGA